ncbi:MAG: tripartite tricarboxylate transporter permease, partial [Campylobacteraceae bacterium]|nr:tripartite tricarboxylate transporter permease [Campylobacteraceae bacterium]
KAGKALAIAAYASFSGGTIAAIFLLFAAPALAKVSLSFQSSDYFALMVLGLTAVAAFAGKGKFLKAAIMTIFGLMLATVGSDADSGVSRYTFGNLNLIDGISFLLLAMASFALSEALMNIIENQKMTKEEKEALKKEIGSLKVSKEELKIIAPVIGRSSVLGVFVVVLPGAGATIASFLAYGMERSIANVKEKLKFGKGSLRGLAAPESANNAACSGSFVPLLTLGIPGSGTTAVILGALISYGIQPGPTLYTEQPALFWSVIISMYIGNLILLVLNLPLIPYIAKLLATPKQILLPLVMFFSLVGVYLVTFNTFDIYMMVLFSVVAVFLRIVDYPMAPMILGFILGGMMENNLRRALTISDGSLSFLWERPITTTILVITALMLIWPLISQLISGKMEPSEDK